MLPSERLGGGVLRSFAVEFPTVQLRLHVEALGAIYGDGPRPQGDPPGPFGAARGRGSRASSAVAAGSIPMVPVAAPDHPLGRMDRIPLGCGGATMRSLSSPIGRAFYRRARDYSVMSPKTWRLADSVVLYVRCCAKGIGRGNMPLPMIESGSGCRRARPACHARPSGWNLSFCGCLAGAIRRRVRRRHWLLGTVCRTRPA